MSLSADDIQAKRFHDAFRGYNHEEVDVFLDQVAASFNALHQQLSALQAEVTTLRETAASAEQRTEDLSSQALEVRGLESMLKRTLLAAQRAADEALGEAQEQARQTLAAAEEQAAASEALATQRAEEIVANAHARVADLAGLAERLRAFDVEHRSRLREHMEGHLAALDALEAVPEPPAVPAAAVIAADEVENEDQDPPAPSLEPEMEVVPAANQTAGRAVAWEPPEEDLLAAPAEPMAPVGVEEPPMVPAEPPPPPSLPEAPPLEMAPPAKAARSRASRRRASSFVTDDAGKEPGQEPAAEPPPPDPGFTPQEDEPSVRKLFWGKD